MKKDIINNIPKKHHLALSEKETKIRDKLINYMQVGKGRALSMSSKKTYAQRLKRLHKISFPDKPLKSPAFIWRKHKTVLNALKKADIKDSVKSGILSAVFALYETNRKNKKPTTGEKNYRIYFEILNEKNDIMIKKQLRNAKQKKKWLTPKMIEEGRKKLLLNIEGSEKGKFRHMQNLIIYDLYTLFPPRRTEYGQVKIDPSKGWTGNALITNNGKFHKFLFKKFKLSQRKEPEEFDRNFIRKLPNGHRLLEILDRWLKLNHESEWFLGKELIPNTMSKRVTLVMKQAHGITTPINVLRHIYISNFLSDIKNTFIEEREPIHKFMSHSSKMADEYRKRLDDDEIEELKEVKNDKKEDENEEKEEKIEDENPSKEEKIN